MSRVMYRAYSRPRFGGNIDASRAAMQSHPSTSSLPSEQMYHFIDRRYWLDERDLGTFKQRDKEQSLLVSYISLLIVGTN